MKSISSICSKSNIRSLCIGKFDGMHLGHQVLFSRLDPKDGGVLRIVHDSRPLLTPDLANLIACSIYEVKLHEVRDFDCASFALFLKSNFPSLQKVIVGYDFRFGKDRSCTPQDLEEFFEVCIVDEVRLHGIAIHRQAIIEALRQGEISLANAMLSRQYHIKGKVIRGQGLGSKECVPTINLEINDYFLPKSGVYATWSEVQGVRYESVSFLGHRLSSDGEFAFETHLLHPCIPPSSIICTSEVGIYFVEFLRENQKFDSLSLLKEQIQKDISQAQKILKTP